MTNIELIDLFRNVERSNHPVCNGCPMKYTCDKNQITRCLFGTAADALEAADERIAKLEAQIPKEGVWIQMNGHRYCSRCGHKDSPILTHYCPNCGARMKGEREEDDANN